MKAFLAAASLFAIPIAGAQVPTGSAQTFPDLRETTPPEPSPPRGSPPRIIPGTLVKMSGGDANLRQFVALAGSEITITLRGTGLIAAVLYDADGTALAVREATTVARIRQKLPKDGVYYLAPIAPSGSQLELSLDLALPPPPPEPDWMRRITKLPTIATDYGPAFPIAPGQLISGNFAQAAVSRFDPARSAVLYRFEGRLAQRVTVAVRSSDAHSLVWIARGPSDPKMLRSSDAQYKGDVGYDSVLDRYLPADGTYFIIVQTYADGPKGQRDLSAPGPSAGEFTIEMQLK